MDPLARFAGRRGLAPRWLRRVLVFGLQAPDLPRLETLVERERLEDRAVLSLAGEIDDAQAAMFGRRLGSVLQLTSRLCDRPEGRLLRAALVDRIEALIAGPAPRALRIRACADYFYSQAALLAQEDVPGLSIEAMARTAEWRSWPSRSEGTRVRAGGETGSGETGSGLAHARLEGRLTEAGPCHINLLRIQPGAARLRCVRVPVEARRRFPRWSAEQGARAALSGGFFLYSEADIAPHSQRYDPVGLLLHRGTLLSPPLFPRAALLVDQEGAWRLGAPGPEGATLLIGDTALRLNRLHAESHAEGACWTRASCAHVPAGAHALVAIVGHRVVATAPAGRPLAVPLHGLVCCWPRNHSAETPQPGTRVHWSVPALDGIADAIAGGPVLLRDGRPCLDLAAEDFRGSAPPQTFSQDETGDHNLLPRMALGLHPDGSLIAAAVDGRNLDRALGLTLGGCARLLAALGCDRALNLDGGSSKRMVIAGETVDLASTEVVQCARRGPSRPVQSAILIH